jgi:hypothetical protein
MKKKKLTPQMIKILKMFHILFVFSWIVGGLVLCLLTFITYLASGDELYMCPRILQKN